jgi:hypothetical protein
MKMDILDVRIVDSCLGFTEGLKDADGDLLRACADRGLTDDLSNLLQSPARVMGMIVLLMWVLVVGVVALMMFMLAMRVSMLGFAIPLLPVNLTW